MNKQKRLERQGTGAIETAEPRPVPQWAAQLSAGQRKRLEILMVLLKTADLYIIHEPLAGIDVDSKTTVMQAILESTKGKTLLVIMHGDSEFHGHFDRILDLARLEGGIPAVKLQART